MAETAVMMSKPCSVDESEKAEQPPKTTPRQVVTHPHRQHMPLVNGITDGEDGEQIPLNGHENFSTSDGEEYNGLPVSNGVADRNGVLNYGLDRRESDSDEGCEADSAANGPVLPPRPLNMGLMARDRLHTSNHIVPRHGGMLELEFSGRHWPASGFHQSESNICATCGRRRRPQTVNLNSLLPDAMWRELDHEGFVSHGYSNHMNSFSHIGQPTESSNDMESYFNTNAHLLNMPADAASSPEDNTPSVFGDDWSDGRKNELEESPVEGDCPSEQSNLQTITCTKLSTSSEDQGDFIETDLSLTPRMGSSSCANSRESSTEDLLDVDGGNDEGVCVQCTHKDTSHQSYDEQATKVTTRPDSITSNFKCNCDEHCDDLNSCQLQKQRCANHGYQCPSAPSCFPCDLELTHSHCRLCRQSSKDGQKDEGIMDGTTSESSSYFSPDLDIDILDFDVDTLPNAKDYTHADDGDTAAHGSHNSSCDWGGNEAIVCREPTTSGSACTSRIQNNIGNDVEEPQCSRHNNSGSNITSDNVEVNSASCMGGTLSCLDEALSASANERADVDVSGCRSHDGCCDTDHPCVRVEVCPNACRCNTTLVNADHAEVFCTVCFQNIQNARDEESMSISNHPSNNLGVDGGESGHCSEIEDELYNVSRQTSTSNFDQDENSFQEEEEGQTWQPCCTCSYHSNDATSSQSNITADNVYDEFLKNIERGKMRYKNNNYKDAQLKLCQPNTNAELQSGGIDAVERTVTQPAHGNNPRGVLLRQPCLSDDDDEDDDDDHDDEDDDDDENDVDGDVDDDDSPEMPVRSNAVLEMSRLAASSRASTWPRCSEDESPISALKLLEYEFSMEGANWNRRVFSTAGRFALSDDDSPINAAHLLPQDSSASPSYVNEPGPSSSKDEERDESQFGDVRKKVCKGRTDKTQMLLHLHKDACDGEKSGGVLTKDGARGGGVMIWSEYEAYNLQVKQIGTSACGATAVINVLKAFDFPYVDKKVICDTIKTNLRAEHAPLPEYLLSRSSAGTTAECLIHGIDILTNGAIFGRFFSFYPARNIDLFSWLASWIQKGAVPLMTLNLQRQHGSAAGWGWAIPDAWHHQMCYGLTPAGVYLTNPLQVVSFSLLREQLTSDGVLLVRRQDVISRWSPDTNLSHLLQIPDPRWRQMNVLGQVINILREANMPRMPGFRPQLTTHVSIPAWYQAGITLFVRQESSAYEELKNTPELPLKSDPSEEKR